MLIFIMTLLLGAVLIGVGISYKIQLKQRILPSNPNSAVSKQGMLKPAVVNSSIAKYDGRGPDRLV
jgi:predicted RND superfamily exporter protein